MYISVPRAISVSLGLSVAALLLIGGTAWAQPASAPAAALAPVLPNLKQKTPLPVLLPAHLPPLLGRGVFASVEGSPTAYTIRLESEPDCNQAEVCFVGVLRAQKGALFTFPEEVLIDKVVQGRFQPSSCATGTCSPPAIQWKLNGVLYTAQLTLRARSERDQRSALLQLAESAVRSGAR
jgi:hypothetical protein